MNSKKGSQNNLINAPLDLSSPAKNKLEKQRKFSRRKKKYFLRTTSLVSYK